MEEIKEVKYSSYTESQKRATKKYRENNREKVNEQRKKYYQNRKAKDPNFLEYKRQKAKYYYQKKKALLAQKNKEESKEESKVQEHPNIYELKEDKKKRKYNKISKK